MSMLLKNVNLVDPSEKFTGVQDILIENGKIAAIASNLAAADVETVDCGGLYAMPGLVDIHCHLRDPGLEYKEDIVSGTRAAAKGGFTSICCMANTKPAADNPAIIAYIRDKAQREGAVRVYPIGALSKGLSGQELAEIGEMKRAGIVAVSDDGMPVMNAGLMRLAMLYAADFNLKILDHCEDKDLVDGGVMNEGYRSTQLGLRGATGVAEQVQIARDILLAENENLPVHICHVSTAGSVALIRAAKAKGVPVTCETAPHYLTATEDWVNDYDANTRVNPPLRTAKDMEALIEGLCDGTIDCIATDHAPHHIDEKRVEFDLAASGISGFETAFQLCYKALVESGKMDLTKMVKLMTVKPAGILNLPGGRLYVGGPADIAVADLNVTVRISAENFASKGKNTPFSGLTVKGKIVHTLVGGQFKLRNGEIEG